MYSCEQTCSPRKWIGACTYSLMFTHLPTGDSFHRGANTICKGCHFEPGKSIKASPRFFCYLLTLITLPSHSPQPMCMCHSAVRTSIQSSRLWTSFNCFITSNLHLLANSETYMDQRYCDVVSNGSCSMWGTRSKMAEKHKAYTMFSGLQKAAVRKICFWALKHNSSEGSYCITCVYTSIESHTCSS